MVRSSGTPRASSSCANLGLGFRPCRRGEVGGGRWGRRTGRGQDGCGEGRGATRGRRGGGCPPRSARATWVRARGASRTRARGNGRAAIDRSRDRRDGRGDRRSRSAHRGGGAVLLHADLARGVRPDGGQARGLGAEAGEAADLRGGGGAMRRRRASSADGEPVAREEGYADDVARRRIDRGRRALGGEGAGRGPGPRGRRRGRRRRPCRP